MLFLKGIYGGFKPMKEVINLEYYAWGIYFYFPLLLFFSLSYLILSYYFLYLIVSLYNFIRYFIHLIYFTFIVSSCSVLFYFIFPRCCIFHVICIFFSFIANFLFFFLRQVWKTLKKNYIGSTIFCINYIENIIFYKCNTFVIIHEIR